MAWSKEVGKILMEKQYQFLKKNGIFYTGEKLAYQMIKLLEINYKKTFSLIEPAVGEGHILSIIVEEYFRNNMEKSSKEKKKFLENNITGFDIRPDALEVCRKKLDAISKRYISENINWDLKNHNILNKNEVEKLGKYDYVISNPPYVSRHNMDIKTIKSLKEQSEFCLKFNFDFYYYFIEMGIKLWNKVGKMVYITPNSYTKARSAEVMLKNLIDNNYIEKIIDFKDKMLFEDATTYSAITLFSKVNDELKVEDSSGNTVIRVSYSDLINKYSYKIYNHEFLSPTLNNYINLGDISDIRNGLATLQDKVFIISHSEIIRNTEMHIVFKKNSKEYKVEKTLVKKVIRASRPQENKYVIFPYYRLEQSKGKGFAKYADFKEKFPEAYEYLINELSPEYQKKYGIYLGRTQGFNGYENKKIIIPKVAYLKNGAFKLVEEGFLLSGLSIVFKNNIRKVKLKRICDYLNSEVVSNYLEISSKDYSAGYKSISSAELKLIKIPNDLIQ
ncbi:Eco57I restriction-modification methylase domain-containing protein [Lactococcus lactis]|uniref:Eco57I restriction-modification methylase domain-containing protein n=1 Tax=Lactococcus lactis TaxID=1358 RepID=UPI00204EFAEE|nr:N-6 DNA methylase [Lactococcus lactis]BDH85025.1 hypothetical protein LLID5_23100 [Lactococcus lactis]